MRLHRFYVSESIGSRKEITIDSEELISQLTRVFRLKSGDAVVLFDGSGSDYECVIKNYDRKSITFCVVKSTLSRFVPSRKISLYAAVVKKDTFEWIAEKATELGVTKIIPIRAERSEKKHLNEGRLQKIVIEASEQSGRGSVPMVGPIVTLKESLEMIGREGVAVVVFHTEGEAFDMGTYSKQHTDLAVFIGPEGGWSPAELEMFHSYKVPIVCLGAQILRAETAVVAALSLTMLGNGC